MESVATHTPHVHRPSEGPRLTRHTTTTTVTTGEVAGLES